MIKTISAPTIANTRFCRDDRRPVPGFVLAYMNAKCRRPECRCPVLASPETGSTWARRHRRPDKRGKHSGNTRYAMACRYALLGGCQRGRRAEGDRFL